MKNIKFLAAIALVFILCGVVRAEDKLIPAKVAATIDIPTWYHEGLYFDGKYIWIANGLKGKIWVIDPANGKQVREIKPAGTFTETAISREEGLYIVTDWDMEKLYTARIENDVMSIQQEVPFNQTHPAGAVWNGKNLFVITWTRSLTGTKFNLLKMDDKFNTIKNYQIKDIQEPCQIAWDGKNLWLSSWYDRRIYKLDPDTMDILGHINSPVKKTTGIAWDGAFLWVTGTYSNLYKIELQN